MFNTLNLRPERTLIRESSLSAQHLDWSLIELEDRGFYNITVPPKYKFIPTKSSCQFCDNRENGGVLIINIRTKEIRCKQCGELQPKKIADTGESDRLMRF